VSIGNVCIYRDSRRVYQVAVFLIKSSLRVPHSDFA